MKAVILAGGGLAPSPRLTPLLRGAGLVIAADSGLRHATALGLQPDVVVGDFDSVAQSDLNRYPSVPRLRHPVHKDHLDLELAIELALDRGARELVLLGAFGSRLDQSLAALLIGCRVRRSGVEVSLHDGTRDAYPLVTGDELALVLAEGLRFSLLALEEARCTVTGARYPLTNALLPFGVGLGTANVSCGKPRVKVHGGLVVVIVEPGAEAPPDNSFG